MKHLIKVVFTFIAATLFTAASAQNTGAYLKFDIEGKTVSLKGKDLDCYNNFEPGDADNQANNQHVFYVTDQQKQTYKLDITILTPPHTNPVAGKLPFVPVSYKPGLPCPAAYLYLTKTLGTDLQLYNSKANSAGSFEITKVAAGWVEGKFNIDISDTYYDDKIVHITNGTFRFKIAGEWK